MTQITVRIENPSILDTLKRVISAFDGVSIVETRPRRKRCELDRAIAEVQSGHLAGPFSTVDELFADLNS